MQGILNVSRIEAGRLHHSRALVDAGASTLKVAGEAPQPAGRVHGAVVRRQQADPARPLQDLGQRALWHQLTGEAVALEGRVVLAHALGLCRVIGHPQHAGEPELVPCAHLAGDREHVQLGVEGGPIAPGRHLWSPQPAGLVVAGSHAGHEEAAVAAGGAPRHREGV